MITKFKLDTTLLEKGSYISERKSDSNENKPVKLDSFQIKKWKETGKFSDQSFQNRLNEFNLDINGFFKIIENKEVCLREAKVPWINSLIEVLNTEYNSSDYVKLIKNIPFNNFILPFIAYADRLLVNKMDLFSKKLVNWTSIRESLLSSLAPHLSNISIKALIKEIHISRKIGELEGTDSESRYNYFNDVMLNNSNFTTEILAAYPVLARLLVEKIHNYIDAYTEALNRYLQDYSLILKNFNFEELTLKGLRSDYGDPHKNGRTVIIFEYTNQERLVYKPRSMNVDVHFNELLEWINCREGKFNFKPPSTMHCGTYGWQEFITYEPCKDLNQIELFYYRQGGYLALLYLLRSKDFHYENIIAHGAHPVLIDLETLFDNEICFQNYNDMFGKVTSDLQDSVLSSAMLPFNFAKRKGMDLDFSALGILEEGESAEFSRNYVLDNANTDEIRLIETPVIAEKKENLPFYNDKSIYANDYISVIEKGFRTLYTFFLKSKKELASINGPIYRFKNDEIRHVFRATNLYANYISSATHPDYLQDGLQRNRLFDILWTDVKNEYEYTKFVNSEYNDLLNQDIPYFTFKFDSKDLINSKGDIITNFYQKTSMDLVLKRCQELSLDDCRRQQRYIRFSLSTLNKKNEKSLAKPLPHSIKNFEHIEFLEEAKRIGEEIANHISPLGINEEINNFALSIDKNGGVNLGPLDEGIYDGLAGVGLFFAQLAYEINDDYFKNLATKLFEYAYKISNYNKEEYKNLSAYTGSGSILYTATYLYLLWEDDKYKNIMFEYIDLIDKEIGHSASHDYLAGEAGVLLLCLRIYKKLSCKKALLTAKKCGEYLLKLLSVDGEKEKLLAGMSHGASGYAWPLLLLGYETGDKRFISIATDLIEYENTLFDEKSKNWMDLRLHVKNKTASVYWCHGAPGIALARVNMLSLINHQDDKYSILKKNLEVSVESTLEKGFYSNHCLCHGDLGNIDVLLTVARQQKDDKLLKKVVEKGYGVLNQGRKIGWMNGIDQESEMYGLMIGLSGIGFELLRLWNNNIPSILDLELPLLKE